MKEKSRIKVNKGAIETLVKVSGNYGLFQTDDGHQIVRNIQSIKPNEIIKDEN